MIQQTSEPAALVQLLQAFFTEHLISHRLASQQTVDGYRDTFRLLLESSPCLPSRRYTGPAATAARNSPLGSDH